MIKTHFSILSSLLIFILLAGCTLTSQKLTEYPPCKGSGCSKVPTSVKWPDQNIPGYSIELGRFKIQLDNEPVKIVSHLGGDLSLILEEGEFISLTISQDAKDWDKNTPENTNYTTADIAELIFKNSPTDLSRPKNSSDLWYWNRAMFLKGEFFDDEVAYPPLSAQKGSLTAYFWQNKEPEGYFAWVFDAKRRDSYLKIYANDMTFDEFKMIVGSISLKNN